MESPGRIGIVAALAAEARTLGRASRFSGRVPGGLRALPDGSLLAVSGMGFDAAERSARALADSGCSALVSWGLAGGLDPRFAPGTVVVPDAVVLDGARDLSAHSAWGERVLHRLGASARGGKLLTSRRPLASVAEKQKAFVASGAVAVDMESYSIAAVATGRGLPFLAIRVIVDAADHEVPAALLDAADTRGRLAVGPLLVRILSSPALLAPMLRLARRFAVARRALRTAARKGAPGRP